MLHILSLEDDSHSHEKFDTLYKDGQPFHRLSNSTLSVTVNMLHLSDLITHVIRINNAHNINSIMILCA
jgi:hypothetical protein